MPIISRVIIHSTLLVLLATFRLLCPGMHSAALTHLLKAWFREGTPVGGGSAAVDAVRQGQRPSEKPLSADAGGHVVFIYGLTYKKPALAVAPAAMHVTAALLTLNNFRDDGCHTSIPIILTLGACMATLASVVSWKVGTQQRAV